MPKKIEHFVCETCGASFEDESAAELCESRLPMQPWPAGIIFRVPDGNGFAYAMTIKTESVGHGLMIDYALKTPNDMRTSDLAELNRMPVEVLPKEAYASNNEAQFFNLVAWCMNNNIHPVVFTVHEEKELHLPLFVEPVAWLEGQEKIRQEAEKLRNIEAAKQLAEKMKHGKSRSSRNVTQSPDRIDDSVSMPGMQRRKGKQVHRDGDEQRGLSGVLEQVPSVSKKKSKQPSPVEGSSKGAVKKKAVKKQVKRDSHYK